MPARPPGTEPAPPSYVEYGGRLNTPPSFPSTGGRFRGFVLHASRERLAALCEQLFNAPAQGAVEYRAIGANVLLLVGSFADVRSTASGFEQVGSTHETQASVWVPVAAGHTRGGRFAVQRLCMAVPYIWVDNPMSLTGGREIYGYPKSLGRFDPPDAVGERVSVETYGGNFHPTSKAGWHPVLEIRRGRAAAGAQQTGAWDAAPSHSSAVPGERALLARLARELVRRRLRQVFLKQFRHASADGGACYRAVVEAPVRVTRARWRLSLRPWSVLFHHLDSHPLAAELGLASQVTRRSYSLEMDMVAEPGVVVAESAGDDAGSGPAPE